MAMGMPAWRPSFSAHAGEDGGNPVGDLDPGEGGLERLRRDVEATPDPRPEPFRRIDAAAFGDVLRAQLQGEFGDLCRLPPTRVVLPQPALRRKVMAPLLAEGERAILFVDRQRARSGGVHPKPDDFCG